MHHSYSIVTFFQEVHSYKEDLDPLATSEDVVDGASQTTPMFPVSPGTYSNQNPNSRKLK